MDKIWDRTSFEVTVFLFSFCAISKKYLDIKKIFKIHRTDEPTYYLSRKQNLYYRTINLGFKM